MARVTVEDCIEKVPNRFGLVLLAGHRARSIANGAALTIDRDNDKNPVVALREIADDTVAPDELRETIITTLQRVDERTEAEDEAEVGGVVDAFAVDAGVFGGGLVVVRVDGVGHGASPFRAVRRIVRVSPSPFVINPRSSVHQAPKLSR